MVQKFGIYGIVANLVPGLAFLWALSWLAAFFGHGTVVPVSGSIGDASVLIAWAYITGLLIQGIAQSIVEKIILAATGGFPSARWLFDGDEAFSEQHRKELKEAISNYFGDPVEPAFPVDAGPKKARALRLRRYQEVFYLCYNLVDQKKLSDRPLAFNAHYGLFRAVFTMTLMLVVVFATALASKWNQILQKDAVGLFQCILVFLILASIISYLRMKKRGEDFAKSIYDLFYTFYRGQAGSKG
jgi:hypothetical protein